MTYAQLYNARYLQRPRKVYIAASNQNADEISKLIQQLQDNGHTVTLDWTIYQHEPKEQMNEVVKRRIKAIGNCDLFIFYGDSTELSHLELGIAIALEKQIVGFEYPVSSMVYYEHEDLIWLS